MKRVLKIICVFILAIVCVGCITSQDNDANIKIITTNFPTYDFARAVIGEESADIQMLLKPGQESHSFDPSPKDIIAIEEADVFIYIGGESDTWVNTILDSINIDAVKIIRLMDYIDGLEEEIKEGMQEDTHDHDDDHDHNHEDDEHDHEYDEHIWTSPKNAIKMVKVIEEGISSIDLEHQNNYQENANQYIQKIEDIDTAIIDVIQNSNTNELIFGDRFPFLYLVKDYGIDYYAAFPGCSEQTDINAKTLAFLIERVETNSIPVVLHIELSNPSIAETISAATGAKVLELHSAHNISKDDFTAGITYVDIMTENITVLKEALN